MNAKKAMGAQTTNHHRVWILYLCLLRRIRSFSFVRCAAIIAASEAEVSLEFGSCIGAAWVAVDDTERGGEESGATLICTAVSTSRFAFGSVMVVMKAVLSSLRQCYVVWYSQNIAGCEGKGSSQLIFSGVPCVVCVHHISNSRWWRDLNFETSTKLLSEENMMIKTDIALSG